MRRDRQSGFSLVETLVAVAMTLMAIMAAVIYVQTASRGTKNNTDKSFAVQKAMSMLEELKAVVETTTGDAASLLDNRDDGNQVRTVLTTDESIVDPDHPASGNIQVDGRWQFGRQVSVRRFSSLQTKDVRLVNVKVFRWEQESGRRKLLAEVSSVIRTIADNFPPTQVYDVYCLAIENIPGWWVYMANLVPFTERAIQELQSRNPGLEFRTHWIRTGSYGRDREYAPYINQAADTTSDIDDVYFYPGTLPSGSAVGTYYVPGGIRGKIRIDGTLTHGYDATTHPLPYALADTYNHAMRFPDEQALFDSRVVAGLDTPEEPTLRLLLEEMYRDPDKYRNAMVINLHGELFPFPPIRNFSDPAKEPVSHPGVRAAAHPEQLRYDNGDDVALRVYSYLTDPSDASVPDVLGQPISVVIRGLGSLPGLTVEAVEGGPDHNGDSIPDSYYRESGDGTDNGPGDMYYTVQSVAAGTLIRLYRSPLRSPCADSTCSTGGLAAEKRLYGMDYIPTPLDDGTGDFSRDLAVAGNRTKNTARWRIVIPAADLSNNSMLTFETRIGDDLTTGVLYPTRNEPTNLSRTYAWRGSDLWIFGDGTSANPPNLPLTERFQIIGDPRHSPYADSKKPFGVGNPLGLGYNRYFDDFHNGSGGNKASDADYWPGFTGVKNDADPANDGWWADDDLLEIDVNRILQVYRSTVLRAQSVFTTLTGWSFFYVGIGNEIGYDGANAFPDSIPVSWKPYDGTSGTRREMSITDDTYAGEAGGVKYVKENLSSNYWWSINWLGELYPDSLYASNWVPDGNLPTGSGSDRFVRVRRDAIQSGLPTGTTFLNTTRRTKKPGCTDFFSVGTVASKFHHDADNSGTGDLVDGGLDIAGNFNFAIPDTVSINRPFNFNLSGSGPVPQDFQDATYDVAGLSVSALADYYDHSRSGMRGSAALEFDGNGADVSFVAVNGISNTAETGSAFMGRWSFLTLIQTFLEAGRSSHASRIVQLPQIRITAPDDATDLSDPSSIAVAWSSEWKRWDGLPYTSDYSSTFAETTPVRYALMYSDDGGKGWKYVQDDSIAQPGLRPSVAKLTTATTYTLNTPASKFPQASYVLRVEAYRTDFNLHYSYHQQSVYIKR